MLGASSEPEMDFETDFETAMHFATRSVRVLRMHLGAARWAQPDRYSAIEALINEANTLERHVERERTRADRERNDN